MSEYSPDMQCGAKHIADNEAEMMARLSDEALYEDLERDFADWFASVSAKSFDEALLDDFLAEMGELKPLDKSFDSQKSLEEFHNRLSDLSLPHDKQVISNGQPAEPSHKNRRFFRWGAIVAATIAIMMASMVTAQAFGVDIFGFLARWTDEIFFFETAQSQTREQRTYPMAEGESIEYDSIDEALAAFGVDFPLSPKWLPDYVVDLKVTGSVMPYGMLVLASFEGELGSLTIIISEFSLEDGPPFIIEKDSEKAMFYNRYGQGHYIVEDNDFYKATWIVDNIQCVISGFVTEEELTKMIDSIYEVV